MRAHRRVPRAFVMSLTTIVVATSVATTPASADQTARALPKEMTQAPRELPDEGAASTAARKFAKPVRVSSKTNELSEVTANPDGTFTFTTAARPQRVRRGNDWVGVDTKLRKNTDGSITPGASTVDVRLAGGTGKPFVVASREGVEIGLSWPAALPEPKLDGDTATYPEVLPGVDLQVKATDSGFVQLLVVKTAQAAQQPALRKITFGSHVKGGTLTQNHGRLELKDPTGKVTFVGNPSMLQDSASRQAKTGTELTSGQISVLPDQKFLADPNTDFPVSIAHEYPWGAARAHHAVVQSGHPTAKNYDVSWGDLSDLKAGLAPDGSGVSRSYVELNVAPLTEKRREVSKATLSNRVINSYNCQGAGRTQIHLTNNFYSDVTWNNQPIWGREIASVTRTNNPDFCPSDGGADFDITDIGKEAVGSGWTKLNLGYQGSTVANTSAWRRFDLNPRIEVKYNSYPNPPDEHSMQNGQIPCVTGADRPYVGTKTPRMRARVSDPDGGNLFWSFRVTKGPVGSDEVVAIYQGGDTPSGSFAERAIDEGALTDGIYHWSINSGDGYLGTEYHGNCEFVVDTVRPVKPYATSKEYPTGRPGGGVGVTGTFTLDAVQIGTPERPPVNDVVKFLYSFTDEGGDTPEKVVAATAPGRAEIRYTPRLTGPLTLYVRSEDRAGNRSDIVRYEFFVLPGANPLAHWKFDGSLTDTNGGNAFTPNGNPNLTLDGYADKAIGLTGPTDYLSRPAVFDSAKSFSVSAWAKLDNADTWRVIAAGAGNTESSFSLEFTGGDIKKWTFGLMGEDANGLPAKFVTAQAPPRIGVWTHLVGTYDAATGKVVLYVDGVKQGETTADKTFTAGRLLVGRKRVLNEDRNNFVGGIDELRAYDRTLNDAEVSKLANQSVQRAYFPLSEGTGKTTKDIVTGRSGTLTGAVNWVREEEYTSVNLDGTTGYITSPAPAIRTDKSFTVSAFVNLPERDDKNRTIFSLLPANGSSPFSLQYRGVDTKSWMFIMPSPNNDMVWVTTPSATNDWVQVTAVYDGPNTEMRLYVNGQFIGRKTGVPGTAPVPATFEMGRTMWQDTITDYWRGGLDDVRVFAGALTDEEISRYAVRNP